MDHGDVVSLYTGVIGKSSFEQSQMALLLYHGQRPTTMETETPKTRRKAPLTVRSTTTLDLVGMGRRRGRSHCRWMIWLRSPC
jgi:hypothetical protein